MANLLKMLFQITFQKILETTKKKLFIKQAFQVIKKSQKLVEMTCIE